MNNLPLLARAIATKKVCLLGRARSEKVMRLEGEWNRSLFGQGAFFALPRVVAAHMPHF